MANKKELTKILKEQLLLSDTQDKGRCIVIYGDWGTGKTYFWNNEFKTMIGSDDGVRYTNFGYASLFGHKTVETIKKQSLESVYFSNKVNSIIKKSRKFLTKSMDFMQVSERAKMALFGIDALLSVISKADLKECIICFDDIERCHNDLDLDEFLGYISELVENKKCKIILLMNKDELFKKINNDEEKAELSQSSSFEKIYNKYKEKVIDLEIEFTPTIEDNFDIGFNISSKVINDNIRNILLHATRNAEENNIRVIYKSIEVVDKFYTKVKELLNIKNSEQFTFVRIYVLALAYWRFGKCYDGQSTRALRRYFGNQGKNYIEEYYDKSLRGIIPVDLTPVNGDIDEVNNYLEYGTANFENFEKIISVSITQKSFDDYRKRYIELETKFLCNMNYSENEYLNDFLENTKTIGEDLIKYSDIFSFNSIIKNIDEENQFLKEFKEKYYKIIKPTKEYMVWLRNELKTMKIGTEHYNILYNHYYKNIVEKYPDLFIELDVRIIKKLKNEAHNRMTNILQSYYNKAPYGVDNYLDDIPYTDLKEWMLEDSLFYYDLCWFCKTMYISMKMERFKNITITLLEVQQELAEVNKLNRFKIEEIWIYHKTTFTEVLKLLEDNKSSQHPS